MKQRLRLILNKIILFSREECILFLVQKSWKRTKLRDLQVTSRKSRLCTFSGNDKPEKLGNFLYFLLWSLYLAKLLQVKSIKSPKIPKLKIYQPLNKNNFPRSLYILSLISVNYWLTGNCALCIGFTIFDFCNRKYISSHWKVSWRKRCSEFCDKVENTCQVNNFVMPS